MVYIAPLLGLFLGILVNLLADSLPDQRSLQRARCQACGAPRSLPEWSALVTLLSSQRSCAYCGTQRGVRSWFVEIFAIIGTFELTLYNATPGYFFPTLVMGFVFLLIVVIDIEHRLILHSVTLPAGILFFLFAGSNPDLTYARSLIGGAFGFGFFLLLYWMGDLFGRWMARRRGLDQNEVPFGFGDVTLATVIGLLLGFPAAIEALLRGMFYAGIFSIGYVIYLSLRRRYSAFIPIPYGPFLILGALWVYFQGWTFLERLVGM
ncbi:MAG: prepilin peptidase [Anaerolineales bacterium]|nr:MAG: prepilin peptidase [Anaerolineales bacterium]